LLKGGASGTDSSRGGGEGGQKWGHDERGEKRTTTTEDEGERVNQVGQLQKKRERGSFS